MSRPVTTPYTDQLYGSLPEYLIDADAADGSYPFLRFLQLEADAGGGSILALINSIDPATNGGVSALLDPATCPPAWLPWLAQLRGVRIVASQPIAVQRQTVALGAYQLGTAAGIIAAAQTVLTGTQTVRLFPSTVTAPGDGQWYDLLILTRPEETPTPSAVVPAVIAAGAKPAGVTLRASLLIASYAHLRDVHGTYAGLEGQFPTYQAMTSHLPE